MRTSFCPNPTRSSRDWFKFLLLFGALLCAVGYSKAASVGPGGYTNAFTMQPLAADWATLGRSGTPSDVYDMDADVNATITAAGVTAQTTSDPNDPPTTATVAVWSSAGLY